MSQNPRLFLKLFSAYEGKSNFPFHGGRDEDKSVGQSFAWQFQYQFSTNFCKRLSADWYFNWQYWQYSVTNMWIYLESEFSKILNISQNQNFFFAEHKINKFSSQLFFRERYDCKGYKSSISARLRINYWPDKTQRELFCLIHSCKQNLICQIISQYGNTRNVIHAIYT